MRRRLSCIVLSGLALVLGGCGESATQRKAQVIDRAVHRAADATTGIPQVEYVLGSASATTLITLYADPSCIGDGCQSLADELPVVIDRYVRPGTVQIAIRPVTTPGYPNAGIKSVYAARLQDKMWDAMLALTAVNGEGVDPDRTVDAIPGINVRKLRADEAGSQVDEEIARIRARAQSLNTTLPSLYIDPPGGGHDDTRKLDLSDATPAAPLTRQIRRVLDDPEAEASDPAAAG